MVVVPAGRVVEAFRLGVGLQREERGPGLSRGLRVELRDVGRMVGVVMKHHRVRVDVRLERAVIVPGMFISKFETRREGGERKGTFSQATYLPALLLACFVEYLTIEMILNFSGMFCRKQSLPGVIWDFP